MSGLHDGCMISSMTRARRDARTLALALAAITLVIVLYAIVLHVTNATTVAVSFLLIVLFAAANARWWVAAAAAVVAMLAFNFYFIPPVGTFTVADRENWIALVAFLAVGLVGSSLSAAMRARAALADEHARLLEERRSAEVARQGEAVKSALLASIAHDLKTPLTAITVAAGNLQSTWLNDRDRHEQAEIVVSEVGRLTRIFDNILDMARIEAGAIATTREWVPAGEIIDAARACADRSLAGHLVEAGGDLDLVVRVDPRLTSAALAHLLNNAARYSPPRSLILLRSEASDEGLRLVVRDHGPGIPQQDLPHLFERFYRGHNAAGTAGTGMGLAIARGLLTAEQGRIRAENAADGGARFIIDLPCEVRQPAAEPRP